jgi:hypothetical protein
MSTTPADLQSFSIANSRTTTSYAGIDNANIWRGSYPIREGIVIRVSHPDATATVVQSFYIEVRLVGKEYIASSNISNSFEIGATPGRAIKNYLELLVDDLTWLEKHKANLSSSVLEDLHLLQSYVRIV